MKTFIFLMCGLMAASNVLADPGCGLTIQATRNYTCSGFLQLISSNEYGFQGVNLDKLKLWNHDVNCNVGIIGGTNVCVEDKTKFDDKATQEGTTLEAFKAAMDKLKRTRSSSFSQRLYDHVVGVVEETQARRKREINDRTFDAMSRLQGDPAKFTDKEKALVEEFANKAETNNIKAVMRKSQKFMDLDADFNRGRKVACKELKDKEKNKKPSNYRKCVCAEENPSNPMPFIQCQAILMSDSTKGIKNRHFPTEPVFADTSMDYRRQARAAGKMGKDSLKDFLLKLIKGGSNICTNIECLTSFCFPEIKGCTPIPPLPLLEFCASGEICLPGPESWIRKEGETVPQALFESSKVTGKLALCIVGFNSVLSWLGLDGCLLAIQLQYFWLKQQADLSASISLIVLKLTVGAKVQVSKSWSRTSAGKDMILQSGSGLCKLQEHKCQDYCLMDVGELAAYAKLEYWWWGWREAFNVQTPTKNPCPIGEGDCCVTAWEAADNQMRSKRFCGDVSWVGNDFNDVISSMKVDPGCVVEAFEAGDYQGRVMVGRGDVSYNTIVANNFNDVISSMKVKQDK